MHIPPASQPSPSAWLDATSRPLIVEIVRVLDVTLRPLIEEVVRLRRAISDLQAELGRR
jgi:hypothetical protein